MDPNQRYELLQKLGEGSYGSVVKARDKESGKIVAIKLIPIEKEDRESLMAEFKVMEGIAHKNIVNQYGMYEWDDHIWFILEYCAAGSVLDMLRVCQRTFSEVQVASIAKQSLEGLAFMHKNRRLHRDIKAGNILITADGTAKLADFGVAAKLSDTTFKRNTLTGTPYWMAPEVIVEQGYDGRADVWSVGITCIEMADGQPPFHSVRPMLAMVMIPNKPPPTLESGRGYSAEFEDFVTKCLVKDPNERPTAEQLLEHPFLKKANQSSLLEMAEEAMQAIADGALDDDEEEDGDAEGGDTTTAPRYNDDTVKYSDDTMRVHKTLSKATMKSTLKTKEPVTSVSYSKQIEDLSDNLAASSVSEQVPDKAVFLTYLDDGTYFQIDGEIIICRYNEKADPIPNSLCVSSGVVSRIHCKFFNNDNGFFVQDMGSSSGTFVNGQRLSAQKVTSEPRHLAQNDEIRLGVSLDENLTMIEGDDSKVAIERQAPRLRVIFFAPPSQEFPKGALFLSLNYKVALLHGITLQKP